MKINKLLCALILFAVFSTSYADGSTCTTMSAKDLYNPIVLDKSFTIRFKSSTISIDPDGDIFPIIITGQNCDTGSEAQIAELPYLGDPGKVESAFMADSDFDGKAELFVIHRTTIYSDTGISYGSDYFTTLVYKRIDQVTYERSERVSSYFGAGGDVLSSPMSDQLTYEYPYKSETSIQSRLASSQYKAWLGQKPITTRISRKTYLHDQPNVIDRTSRYLINGDEVQVLNQGAGWLEAVFHNNKKGDIKGWIQCKDTLECASQNRIRPLLPEQLK
jgi:hypothetical protein